MKNQKQKHLPRTNVKNPNLPSGRQPHPQVATAQSIKHDRMVASGHHKFNKSNIGANTMSNENQNNQEANAEQEVVVTQVEAVEVNQEAPVEVAGEANAEQASTEVVAEGDVEVVAESIAVSDVLVGDDNQEAAMSEEDTTFFAEDEEDEEVEETEGLSLFEQVMQPLQFNYIENVVVFTIAITSEQEAVYTEEGIEEILSEVPMLEDDGESGFVIAESGLTANLYNPFGKKAGGWLAGTFPAIVEFVNDLNDQKLPIIAGTDNMSIAAANVASNMSTMLNGVPNQIAFDNSNAMSGFVTSDEDEIELVQFDHSLDSMYNISSYANGVDEATYNIVNNVEIVLPCFYAKQKKNAYLLKLVKHLEKQVADSNVPVYLNVTFNTNDIINNLDYRDCLDALMEAGFDCITRTQALTAIEDEDSILPADIDVYFASDLDVLFGDSDMLLTFSLTPERFDSSEEDEASEEE